MLPNGFHDSYLEKLTIDYLERKAVFDLDVWIGDLESKEESEREAYRKARLELFNLRYCVIEPPHPLYPFDEGKPLWIDAWPDAELDNRPTNLPKILAEEAFAYAIWVNNWNSYIHVAADDASFEWLAEPTTGPSHFLTANR